MIRQYYGVPNDAKYGEEFMSRFPILFQDRTKDMKHTCMCWGIDCGIGWYYILEQLCTTLEFYNLEFKRNYGIAVIADQVKEKYGTLRFYFHVGDVDANGFAIDYEEGTENPKCPKSIRKIVVDHLDSLADEIIDEAEHLTEVTCAQCGEPLNDKNTAPQDGYWIQYICKECAEKNREEQEREIEEIKKEEEETKNLGKKNDKDDCEK